MDVITSGENTRVLGGTFQPKIDPQRSLASPPQDS